MAVTETRIVTKCLRERPDDSWTIDGALANGAYDALRDGARDGARRRSQEQVKASGLRGRGGAGFGTRPEVVVPAEGRVPALPRGERRRRRAVHVQGPHAHRARPAPAHRGHRHHGVRDPGAPRVHLHARRVRARRRAARRRRSPTRTRSGFLGKNILGSGFDLEIVVHRGAGALHRRRRDRPALEPRGRARRCRASSRRSPRSQGLYAAPTVVNNVETLSTVPHIMRMGGEWYAKMGVEPLDGHAHLLGLGPRRAARQLRGRARHARSATSSRASPAACAAASS